MEGFYQGRVLVQRFGGPSDSALSELSTALTRLVLDGLPFIRSQPRTMARVHSGNASASGLARVQDLSQPLGRINVSAASSIYVRTHSDPRRGGGVAGCLR